MLSVFLLLFFLPSFFSLPERKRLLSGSSTTMPTMMQTMPTGRKLKNLSGS